MSPRVSISLKSAQSLLLLARHNGAYGREWAELRSAIDRCTRVRPGLKKAKATREKKKREKAKDTKSIVAECAVRSPDVCECGCGVVFTPAAHAQLDHFFGRVRAKQSAQNCWRLRPECHRAKTNNQPSAAYWLQKFVKHAEKHGYGEEFRMAARRLRSIEIQEEGVAP
jgi:5-methylcytosine-specific restriction endonuclease McrA